jgi:hypothetical protein
LPNSARICIGSDSASRSQGWKRQHLRSRRIAPDDRAGERSGFHCSFFLNNKLHDWCYAVACPYQGDNPPFSDKAIIGDLGLLRKHKFLYLFDYGDCHQFEVEVVDIQEKAGRRQYPYVVEKRGESPAQYRWQ